MKNVTINLGKSPHKWARVEAAKAGKSLSGWVAGHFHPAPAPRSDQREALKRFLATPDLPGITANRESSRNSMPSVCFVDTNVFLYAKDPTTPGKMEKAVECD